MLFAVAALLVGRALIGPSGPDGLVVISDLDDGQLKHEAFSLSLGTGVHISATGSTTSDTALEPLAAYGWILNRETREVVWQMEPSNTRRGKGTLVRTRDSLSLDPGTYDVYFSTYGPTPTARRSVSFLGLRHHWKQDADAWSLSLQPDKDVPVKMLLHEDAQVLAPHTDQTVWSSAPMGRKLRTKIHLFEVIRTTPLNIYAIGELCKGSPCDYGWIEDVKTSEKTWELKWSNTQPAGGWTTNRMFRGTIMLSPGIYRATFEIDRAHAYPDWRANPPFDPAAWGITLGAPDLSAITEFDPWTRRTPLISLIRVPNDDLRSAQFTVNRPTRFIVSALGEISKGGSLYDYGWIENNTSGDRVWEMSREKSQPAPGENKGSNRVETDFIKLLPGTYSLSYQTDGSHAFGDWRNGEPNHSERWGVTLFPFEKTLPSGAFDLLAPSQPGLADLPSSPLPPPSSLGAGERIVNLTRIGNYKHVSAPMHLSRSTQLHIYAIGEISRSGRYDYGWIERADTGETVWKMTLQNTQHAGGVERNRRFDGVISLPQGAYIVYFKTDYAHAFGDFEDDAPDDASHWGITVDRLPN